MPNTVIGAGVMLLLIIAGVALWFFKRATPLQRELNKVARLVGTAELSDVLLPDGMGGEIHLERLLLTPQGLLILDTRDVKGMVFAGDRMEEWSATEKGKRIAFANPLPGLLDRLAALRAITTGIPVEGMIVFHSSVSFPKGHPANVTTTEQLIAAHEVTANTADLAFENQWDALVGLTKK